MSKSTINVSETSYDDEIDLLELFKIIWNKKILIIIITSLFILLSVFYAFSKTAVYEVKSIFEVGSIVKKGKPTNLENVNALIN